MFRGGAAVAMPTSPRPVGRLSLLSQPAGGLLQQTVAGSGPAWRRAGRLPTQQTSPPQPPPQTNCELKQKWRAGLSHRISRIEVEEAPKPEAPSVPQWKRKQEQEKKAEESERKVEPLWKRKREAEKKQESERKPEQPNNNKDEKQNETQPDMERRRPEPLWKKKQELQKLEPKVEPERKPDAGKQEVTKNNEVKNNVHQDKKLELPKTEEVKKIEPVRKLEPLWKRKFEPVKKPEPEVKEVPAKKVEPIWKRKIEPQEKKEPETKQEPAKRLELKTPGKLEPTWKRKIEAGDKTELKTKPEPLQKQEPKIPGKLEPIWKRKIAVDDKTEQNKQEPVKKPEPLWKRKKDPEKEPEQKTEASKKQEKDEKTKGDQSTTEDLPDEDETEEIICPICSELYDEEEYQPVLLPRCGHTFCRPCLNTVKGKGHFPCPTCRKRHLKPPIEDLPVHNEVLNKANAYREEKAGRCQTHQNLLLYWCYDCQEPLCSSCRVMNGHEVVRTRVVLQEKRQEMKESGKTILDSVMEERKKLINSVSSCSIQLLKACEESAAVECSTKDVKEMLGDTRQTADLSFVLKSLERMKSILGNFRKASSDSESEDTTPKSRRRRERRQTQQDGDADTNEDANTPEQNNLNPAQNNKQERNVVGSTKATKTKEMSSVGQQQAAAAGMQGAVSAEVMRQGPLLSLADGSLWPLTCCVYTENGRRARLSRTGGRLHMSALIEDEQEAHFMIKLPVIQSAIPQDSPEVFLEVAVGERQLGRIYIKLWGHLRRAHHFLALCMGTHGPSYRGAKFDEVFSRGLKGECLHAGPYLTPSGDLSAQRVMDALEWDGEYKGIQKKGMVVGAGSGRPDRDACFDICTIENPSRHFACPFGEVVDGWPTIKAILEYKPVRAVTMVDVGVVVPDGALPVS